MADTTNNKVLLIEDDVFMVDLLSKDLAKSGFSVEIARTGKEGVEKYQAFVPNLMLLDIMLPDQDGLETLRQIRRMPGGPEAKAIILSNIAEGPQADEAKRLGAVGYYVKANLTLTEIVEAVRTVLK